MANPVIGLITCPHCGNPEATVHQEARKKGAMYYRCYGGPNGDCGTVQVRYPGGQKYIAEHMRPLEPEQQDEAAEEAAHEASEEAKEASRKVRREKKAAEKEPPPKVSGVGNIVKGALNILGSEQ